MCEHSWCRWSTGQPGLVGNSAQYPIWLGRTFSFVHQLWSRGDIHNEVLINGFVVRLVAGLASPGKLLPEAQRCCHEKRSSMNKGLCVRTARCIYAD